MSATAQPRTSGAARAASGDIERQEEAEGEEGDLPAGGITVDDALRTSVGEFGFGQRLFFCLAQLGHFPVACQSLVMVFTGLDPVHNRWFECVPGSPGAAACEAALSGPSAPSAQQFCEVPRESRVWTRPGDSIISEWDLTCGDLWKQQAVNSGFFVGVFIGAGLFGTLSDRIGRKKGLYLASLLAGVSGIVCGITGSYWAYFAARLLTGLGVAGVGVPCYVLGCEYVGPAWRGFLGVAAHFFFVAGVAALTLFAWALPSWRVLSVSSGLTSLAFMAVLLTVPESPRWLVIAGRTAEASAVLQLFASWNGTRVPTSPLKEAPRPAAQADTGTGAAAAQQPGLAQVLRHPVLRGRLLVQLVAWLSISCAYYGISLMVADLPGNIYTNNLAMAAVEGLSYVIFSLALDRFGRRWPLAGSYVAGSAFLALSACIKSPTVSIGLALMAKLLLAGAYAAVFIFAAELFPTVVRSASMGWMSQAARVGGILAPNLVLLGHAISFPLFGFLILGVMNAVAGILLFTQPETLGCVMPDSLEDVSRATKYRSTLSTNNASGADLDEVRLIGSRHDFTEIDNR